MVAPLVESVSRGLRHDRRCVPFGARQLPQLFDGSGLSRGAQPIDIDLIQAHLAYERRNIQERFC